MTSSANLTQSYPRNIEDNAEYRATLINACNEDLLLHQEVMDICKNDIIYWIDTFCYTKDPRKDPDVIPFVCYDEYQRDYILGIQNAINGQHDLLTEKSRDMGASWMILYVFVHQWLFVPGAQFRVGSRKEEYVDKQGDMDTLFEKARFCLKRLPGWMLPASFDWRKHSTYMKLINPGSDASIVGEATNPDFSRGGRNRAILLDEYAVWDCDEAVWTATADTTKCRLPVSTPCGAGNKFAILARGTKEKIKVQTLHWTLHPEKAEGAYYLDHGIKIDVETPQEAFKLWKQGVEVRSPWYDVECERRAAKDIAQEIDINYLRSGSPFFSIRSLEKQIKWEEMKRRLPNDPIPHGKYVRAKLVEVDHQVKVRDSEAGWLKIFEMPREGYQYAIGADTSEGLPKGDEATAVVRCKISLNVCAVINGMYKPEDLALKLHYLHKLYNTAEVAPENNNHGYSTCKELEDLGTKLYMTRKDEVTGGQVVETAKRGWSTTPKTRPLMLDDMADEVDHVSCELRDPDLIDQWYTFVNNEKGKPEADGDFLDDLVMAFAICGRVIKDIPFKAKRTRTHLQKERVRELVTRKNAGFRYAKKD